MSIYVVDASVAAKWFFEEEHTDTAAAMLDADNQLHAPDLFLLEMDNLFCKRIRRREISLPEGDAARALLRELPVSLYPFSSLLEPAWAVANETGCSLYDCLYVALAALLQAPMVTADRRLYEALADDRFAQLALWVEDLWAR